METKNEINYIVNENVEQEQEQEQEKEQEQEVSLTNPLGLDFEKNTPTSPISPTSTAPLLINQIIDEQENLNKQNEKKIQNNFEIEIEINDNNNNIIDNNSDGEDGNNNNNYENENENENSSNDYLKSIVESPQIEDQQFVQNEQKKSKKIFSFLLSLLCFFRKKKKPFEKRFFLGTDYLKPIKLFKLALATIVFSGLQFGWALQIALLTPFVIELGMPKELISLVWLCGPIAGLVVQPLVGAISDVSYFRIGRRRPFIFIGGILVVISLFLIPNSLDIGSILGDQHNLEVGNSNPVALTIAVIGFWILDISNNMVQGPCRALIADIAPPNQQKTGNAIFSIWLAIGNVSGYLAGFIDFSEMSIFAFNKTKACSGPCQNLRISFTISIVFFISTMILTLLFADEKPLPTKKDIEKYLKEMEENGEDINETIQLSDKNEIQNSYNTNDGGSNDSNDSNEQTHLDLENRDNTDEKILNFKLSKHEKRKIQIKKLKKIINAPKTGPIIGTLLFLKKLLSLPFPMIKICIVQFVSWFGWFAFLMYITTWVGENIFGGESMPNDKEDPKNIAFEKGVRWGSLGLAGFAITSLLFSGFVPKLMNIFGSKIIWIFGQVCLGFSLLSTVIVWEKWGSLITISSFGISWSVSMCVPFSLTAQVAPDEDKGIYMGILNIFVVLPQLVMSAVGPLLISIFKRNIVAPLLAGSIGSFIGAFLCIILDSDSKIEKRRLKELNKIKNEKSDKETIKREVGLEESNIESPYQNQNEKDKYI